MEVTGRRFEPRTRKTIPAGRDMSCTEAGSLLFPDVFKTGTRFQEHGCLLSGREAETILAFGSF